MIQRVGVEYAGAPAFHSYCMRNSSISHNYIRDVSYSGISFNWYEPIKLVFDRNTLLRKEWISVSGFYKIVFLLGPILRAPPLVRLGTPS